MAWARQDGGLIAGVAAMLGLFFAYGLYTVHATQRVRRYQQGVLARNRRDTAAWLRIRRDASQLSQTVRNMVEATGGRPGRPAPTQLMSGPLAQPPWAIWGLAFQRLRLDLNDALRREAQLAPAGQGAMRRQRLQLELAQFWSISDEAFRLARLGHQRQAADLVTRELVPQRRELENMIGGWLAANRLQQQQAEQRVAAIYRDIERDFILLTLALVAVGAALAFWAIRHNRRAFAHIEALAAQLESRRCELQALSTRLLTLQEDLLQGVARDLHDEFGQLLTAANSMLARAEHRAGADENGEIHAARQVVREAQSQIRNLAATLRPPALDEFGLEPALAAYSGEFSRRTGMNVTFQAETPLPPLPPGRAIHLYRIVQEALNNALRHGQARAAAVRLRAAGALLMLEISDDGRGFDPATASTGAGLPGMRQRAAHLGGTAWIGPRPQPLCGTLVQVTVPLAVSAGLAGASMAAGSPPGI
ncbi:MAG: ATP-binding protein [Terriglobales bacterium]